ncbi:hypothetical protein A2866_05210 [Candidatus Roizmanbacteria bacterium RIFCSPHIGHO2_01_FULL_39_8]|uniref:Glycosyltransferase 2-like domain-containing protein n=1 Tax=Candidatus Roizmanbacteria bacterium RIFCSPHIGHO2_01_FULL_39_8 TaxID=1802033 RepID=A0A1F7GF55_9BACT|nr:MAG: hypothetical protein A2866_05210 [Candidatus Roizmanbacteria bacterium RIFCSPHIGHO2_01_FULL_39_8]
MSHHISLIILVKNEEKTIETVICGARPFVDEIVVVDGHSKDLSRKIALQAGARVIMDNGKGKGAGLRKGIGQSTGDVIVFMDADGSHDFLDIPRLIDPIIKNKADVVIASRALGGSDESYGSIEKAIRTIGSLIITSIINMRFHSHIKDSQNGFRAVKRSSLRSIRLTESIFTIEQEMVIKALKKGLRIVEVASHEYERKYGNSHINLFVVSWRYLWCLFRNII